MAHEQPHGNNDYSYGDFNFGALSGMMTTDQGNDGVFSNDMLFDSAMLDQFGSMPMTVDSTEDMQQFSSDNTPNPTDNAIQQSENQFNTVSNNVPGAGPMPLASFGQGGSSGGSSTLTEFTKRRNWPAKVVEELKDFLQILDANGRIKYVSQSVLTCTGYSAEEVQDVFLKDLIHLDDQGVFVTELNESIASGNSLRIFYRVKKKDGTYTIFETIGHAHIAAAKFAPNPNNQSPFCQAVFMMSRPYPTKNAGLLDSFLEHKIENERLKRRIAELRREEEADNDDVQKSWLHSQDAQSDITGTDGTGASNTPFRGSMDGSRSERSALNAALTRENLEGVSQGARPDSLKDKMARYEGAYTDTIEMLTGLRYVEGERSKGITTGNASPTLIKGDAGIAIPVDRDPRTGEKKKKLKTSEEYVCTDCGMCLFWPHFNRRRLTLKAPLTHRNGARVPTAPRRSATPAVCAGPRRRRRRPALETRPPRAVAPRGLRRSCAQHV